VDPGIPGPSTSVTEGPGEALVPPGQRCQRYFDELATEASTFYVDAAGLKGISDPRTPVANVPLDSGMVGAEVVPDVSVES